ncbi:MAG: hypothetical protein HYX69_09550 [Planctomycetia bacterium]|nr:hypothetical protein [Planctomycetia bacterium]
MDHNYGGKSSVVDRYSHDAMVCDQFFPFCVRCIVFSHNFAKSFDCRDAPLNAFDPVSVPSPGGSRSRRNIPELRNVLGSRHESFTPPDEAPDRYTDRRMVRVAAIEEAKKDACVEQISHQS